MERVLLIAIPFSKIAMDIVGPLPQSTKGNEYMLVACNYATCYPEAVLLKNTTSQRVAKKLGKSFSGVGIPNEILTDKGANFS